MAMTIKPGKLSHEPGVGYTPNYLLPAYTIVTTGNHPYVSNVAIPNGKRGSLLPRGGTYQIATSPTVSAVVPTPGEAVYFTEESEPLLTHRPVDTGEGTYFHFGRICPGSPIVSHGGGTYSFEVEHDPNGEVIVEE